jgi:hypothetical protein
MVHHKGRKGRRRLTQNEASEAITDAILQAHTTLGARLLTERQKNARAGSFALQPAAPLRPSLLCGSKNVRMTAGDASVIYSSADHPIPT